MKIAILGFGREGKSLLKFLRKSPIYKNSEIAICDRDPKLRIHLNASKNIQIIASKNYLKNLSDFDVVFRSPGVPYNLPEIQRAIKKGVKVSSATQLFFEELRGTTQTKRRESQKKFRVIPRQVSVSQRPIVIGITGTKGKGTTATLLCKILKTCKKSVYLAGNIGVPPLEILKKSKKHSIAILELSSFQLQDLKQSPPIAVILDVFPDHLDAHKNLKEYFDAKTSIAKWQKKSDKIFYFGDNRWSKWIASKSRAKKYPVRVHSGHSDAFVISDRDLKMPGEHNFKNAVMAANIALSLGCPKEKVLKVIKNFRGNEHRLEFVRSIRIHSGHLNVFVVSDRIIKFYNDSASTNPQTAAAAVRAFKEPKILIAGGKDKGLNYSPFAKALKNSNTKSVILFGENKKKIRKVISNQKIVIREVKNLQQAVNLAYKTAKQLQQLEHYNNITVIFSPASASFDMFKDYADRGEKFKQLVKKLK
jgi:UDP-N-acetylmuramoylalanine--D-glutamate ligase